MDKKSNTYIDQLMNELEDIKTDFFDILSKSQMQSRIKKPSPWSSLSDNSASRPQTYYVWSDLEPDLVKKQGEILGRLKSWQRRIIPLFDYLPPKSSVDINSHIGNALIFIENRGYGNPTSIREAIHKFEEIIIQIMTIFPILLTIAPLPDILIPDTNILIDFPEVDNYYEKLSIQKCTVIILPTVITELDALKSGRINNELMRKISIIIQSLSKWQKQGNAIKGIQINNATTLVMRAKEPSFENMPKWIDPSIADDRILASFTQIQQETPTTSVRIITNDINMRNKCAMLDIPYYEF